METRHLSKAVQDGPKKRGDEIYFWDESGFRARLVQGTTWGVRGHTPVIRVPARDNSVSTGFMLSMPEALLVRDLPREGMNSGLLHRDAQSH